ncbi:MAG: isopeptide-forming domain-containing fimbrial protein, partial [Planctomycetota bacterium]
MVVGAVSPALGAEKFCSDAPYFGVLDGNVLTTPPTQITIDTDCTFQNWPQSNQLTTTINFQTNDPTIYLIIFDNVFFTGHMACANVDHRIWFANSSDYGSSNACQDLFIPVETIEKKNPAGQTTAAVGVPFTYTLTLPSMQLSGDPSTNDLHTVTLWDDLTATGADLTYVDINAYYKGSGSPVTLVPEDDPLAPGGVWTPKNLSYKSIPLIAAGEQVVVEMTVVLDNTPANTAGTQFINTAKWSFGRLIDGVYYVPLPGEWGVTQPMTIAEPDLVVTKTSSETALNLGVPATFTIDVQNIGGSDAWNVTILDQLPDGPAGGMCDYDPTTGPGVTAQVFAADGVTPVSGPLVQGTDYSVTYSGAPTCQLSLTMLDTPAAKVGSSQHLIITYQSQIDGDSADGIPLTNVAGVTRWFSGDSSLPGRHQYDRGPLTDGTPGVLDFQDSETVTTALAGYYFQKTVANLTSGANPATTAVPGDRLRYRLRIFNVDQTIEEITISDPLDPNSFDLTTFAMVTPPPAGATYSFDSASGLLTISGDTTPLNVAVGGELVIEFEINLKPTLTNGTVVANQASLSAFGGLTATSDDPYVGGIAPPGVPGDATEVVIQSPRPLTKENTRASATIGEQFTYRVTVPATPIAAPLYDVRILDDLGLSAAGLRFVSASVVSGGTWTLSNTGTATDLIIEDTATGIDIPANGQAVIEITVELQNITTNQSGLSFNNSASYTYNRMNGNDATQIAGGAGSTTGMTVVEPNLTATKVASNATPGKAAGDPIAGGDIIQYVVTINNGGNATAYDVNVVDTLPSALTFYSGFVPTATIDLTPVSGFIATPAGTPGGPLVWGRDNGDGSLDIPAGGTLVLTYQTQVLESTAAAFSNLAWVDWTSLNGAGPGERTGAGCPTTTAPDDYCYGPVSVSTTTTDNNSLAKAIVADTYVDAPSAADDKIVRIGDTATYRLTLNLGEGVTRSVTVQDVLPAGMAYDNLVGITPASGSSTFTYSVASQPAAGDADTLTWDLGDVDNAPSNDGTPVDALVIEYRAKVLPDAGIAQTPDTSLNNTATLSYLDAGGNAVVDPTRLVASDTLTLWQPVLSVNKTATPAGGDDIIEAGEAISYTVDIVNMGTAPAYDTVLVDTLPLGMRQGGVTTTSVALVTVGTPLPVLAPAYDANTGVATWDFDNGTADAYTIPAGETLRVVYQLMADADLGAGLTLTNAATATLYYSFDDEAVPANGSVTDRQVYGPTNTAEVSLTTLTPDALLKENTQPTVAIGEQFTYRITVPAAPVNTALYDVRILDDLGASAADLRFVSVAKVSGSGSWTPVNTGSATNLVIEDTAGGIDIPAGEQVVVEVTVELL